jgi:hypothetical protein
MISDKERDFGVVKAWVAFTRLLVIAVYAQSIFAGLFLSGETWGRTAHRVNASVLVAGTLLAGIVAAVTLRHIVGGRRLAVWLFALGIGLAFQMMLGLRAAEGERVLWIHIPFGVALVGITAELVVVAQRLGKPVESPS